MVMQGGLMTYSVHATGLEKHPHTDGVEIMLSTKAQKYLMNWETDSFRK